MVITVIYLLMVKKLLKFKAKNSELIKYPMCLGDLSKDYNTKVYHKKKHRVIWKCL